MREEVNPGKRDGDVCDEELPVEGAATEGELQRLVPIGDDARAIGSYQMGIGSMMKVRSSAPGLPM